MIADPDYARIFTKARVIAWQYGWALSVHGSQTRDLDLLMVPWEKWAYEHEHVLHNIEWKNPDIVLRRDKYGKADIGHKPHGRLAYTFNFRAFGDPRWVDLSVMPRPLRIIEPEPYMK